MATSLAQAVDRATEAYVATCPGCGNLCAATVIVEGMERSNATFVAKLIRQGLTISRIPCDDVRTKFKACACPPKKRARR